MLTREKISNLFEQLNAALKERDVIGEVGICGGAVMCLVFQARESTKDVDGIFAPTKEIREAAIQIAHDLRLPEDWLNDAAKGFFMSPPPEVDVMNLSNLRVWAPSAPYMLAMKCVSARFDSHDADDVQFLIEHLKLNRPDQVFDLIEKFYPHEQIPAKARFLVEELLS